MQLKTTSAMLYLDGISVSFDGFKALNELSFVIEPGEMRAIIGPNGAGKTTMMDVITGKTRPDNGEVYFGQGAYDLSKLDETQIAELGIGRKFQKPTVFDMHTVEDNLLLAQAPTLLLLDEPVAGMTDEETERTAELFLSLAGRQSLVVVEHDMKFVDMLTQGHRKVTVLHEGSVLAEGTLAEVQANAQVIDVYLGR